MTEERGDIATRFQKGNQMWKARSSHGRKPIFSEPEQLLDACCQYFEWCDENPLVTWKPFVTKDGDVSQMEQYYPRPYTLEGMLNFIDLGDTTFRDYEANPDFTEICKHIRNTIRNQKLSGAIAGYYNHSIVARDLGLRDTSDVNVGGQDGNPLKSDMTFKVEFVNAESKDKQET